MKFLLSLILLLLSRYLVIASDITDTSNFCSQTSKGCVNCDNKGCMACDYGYISHKKEDGYFECEVCPIKNCLICISGSCLKCQNGYFEYDGKCVRNLDLDEKSLSCNTVSCSKCINPPLDSEEVKNISCLMCNDHIFTDQGKINANIAFYKQNSNLYSCYTCGNGLYFDKNSDSCLKCSDQNCEKCKSDTCTICKNGYALSKNNSCVSLDVRNDMISIFLFIIAGLLAICTILIIIVIIVKLVKKIKNKLKSRSIPAQTSEANNIIIHIENDKSEKNEDEKHKHNIICFICNIKEETKENPENEDKEVKKDEENQVNSNEKATKVFSKLIFSELTCSGFICNNKKCILEFESKIISGVYFKCKECKRFITGYKDKDICTLEEIYPITEEIILSDNKEKLDNCFTQRNEDIKLKENKDNFPTIQVDEAYIEGKDNYPEDNCCICHDINPRYIIPCENKPKHHLHKLCLDKYLNIKNKCCPICRTDLMLPK